jgi:hypothetical protein
MFVWRSGFGDIAANRESCPFVKQMNLFGSWPRGGYIKVDVTWGNLSKKT